MSSGIYERTPEIIEKYRKAAQSRHTWTTEDCVLPEMTKEGAAWFLAGMIDGEGCVTRYVKKNKTGSVSRYVTIANTDRGLLEACSRACDILGIDHGIYRCGRGTENRKRSWNLSIHRRGAVVRTWLQVPLQHVEKAEKLKRVAMEILETQVIEKEVVDGDS